MTFFDLLGRLGMAVMAAFNAAFLCLLALGCVKILEYVTIGDRDVLIFGGFPARDVFQSMLGLVIVFFAHCAIVAIRQVLSGEADKQEHARR
jgi:hypothetical protein